MSHTDADAIDPTRRALWLGAAVGAALSALGCSTASKPQIPGACGKLPQPFLAGAEVTQAWAGQARWFDAHTHFFNAADVPVRAFIEKSVAHGIESKALREFVIALAPIAEALAHLAPTPAAEMDRLCPRDGVTARATASGPASLDDEIDANNDAIADRLYQEILRSGSAIPSMVEGAARKSAQARSLGRSFGRSQTAPAFDFDFVRRAVRDGATEREDATGQVRKQSADTLAVDDQDLASMQNAFQFVGFMLSYRHYNLRTFIRRQAQHSPSVPLSGCFAAMVDFNHWLGRPGKASNLRDQVLLHEQLCLLSRGFMLPLVPFNPWVDIAEADAAIDTVRWAVEEHGCVGVKLYPPMGFYPYGNEGHPLAGTNEAFPDLKALDSVLARLYALCDKLGVPVMAHAAESNGRDKAHDALAGPAGWGAVAARLTSLAALHVDAGHFGGALAHGDGDWNAGFIALMGQAGPLKVYGDLGYWDELLTSELARQRLRHALQQPLRSGGTVADRTLYGSDWLMLSRVPGWESYAERVAALLREADPGGTVAERVLGANVLSCYGLSAASSRGSYERLRAHFLASGLQALPGWMRGP